MEDDQRPDQPVSPFITVLLVDRRLAELDVKQWLLQMSGLSEDLCDEIAQIFEKNCIAGYLLLELNESRLEKLGIKLFGVQLRILAALALLKTDQTAIVELENPPTAEYRFETYDESLLALEPNLQDPSSSWRKGDKVRFYRGCRVLTSVLQVNLNSPVVRNHALAREYLHTVSLTKNSEFMPVLIKTKREEWVVVSGKHIVPHEALFVGFSVSNDRRLDLCDNENCGKKGSNMGRPHKRCSIRKARLVIHDTPTDYYKVPPTGVFYLHHFKLAGANGECELRAEFFCRDSSNGNLYPLCVGDIATPTQLEVVMKLAILLRYKSKASLCYLGIDPVIGTEWRNTEAKASIKKIDKPATQVQVVFTHQMGGRQFAETTNVTSEAIHCKTPSLPQGEAITFLKDGERIIEGPADKVKFEFVPNMEAMAEVKPPTKKPDTQSGADPVSTAVFSQVSVLEKDSWVYHPDVEGPLTMPLLNEIAERKWYKRKGFNRLIVASFVGESVLVHQLLEEGMDPKSEDHGRSAVWWAKRGWASDIVPIILRTGLRRVEALRLHPQTTTLTHRPGVASVLGEVPSSTPTINNYTWDPKELSEQESDSFLAPMAATDAGIGNLCLFLDSGLEVWVDRNEAHSAKRTGESLHFGGGDESNHEGSGSPRRRQSDGGNAVQLPGRDAAFSPSRVSASSSWQESYLNPASITARENNYKQEVGIWGEEYVHSVVLPHLFSQWLGELSKPQTITGQGVSLQCSNDKYRLVLSWMRGQYLPYDILVEVYDLTMQQQTPTYYYIEAKTNSGTSRKFYLTYNECALAKEHGQHYWIISVTGASTTTPQVAVIVDPVRLLNIQLHQQLQMEGIVVTC